MFKPPNYNLLRYELETTDEDSSIMSIYNSFCKRYAGYEENIFYWFDSLTDSQLKNIYVFKKEYSPHKSVVSKGFIMKQGTIMGYVVCRMTNENGCSYMFR